MDSRGGSTYGAEAGARDRPDAHGDGGEGRQEHGGSRGGEGGGRGAGEPDGAAVPEPHFNCYIVSVFGLGAPVDLPAVRAGLESTLARHPRFRSLQVLDDEGARPKWVRTTVNLDDHVVVPDLDPCIIATSADPDRALEDYVSSLSTLPMDHSRPLWELHVLDIPTSDAAAAVALRVHHSIGDGVSLLSLFIACTRRAVDPSTLPTLPTSATTRRAGPARSSLLGAMAIVLSWVVSFLLLV